jgi:hypothetical protein
MMKPSPFTAKGVWQTGQTGGKRRFKNHGKALKRPT